MYDGETIFTKKYFNRLTIRERALRSKGKLIEMHPVKNPQIQRPLTCVSSRKAITPRELRPSSNCNLMESPLLNIVTRENYLNIAAISVANIDLNLLSQIIKKKESTLLRLLKIGQEKYILGKSQLTEQLIKQLEIDLQSTENETDKRVKNLNC